jgi:parallel beta-helix repeat protein
MGPQRSAHWVRARALPQAFTIPGGGVSFTPASNLQTLINNNVANTVFVAEGNTTYNNVRNINCGSKHPRLYFPAGAIIDGGGTDLTAIETAEQSAEIYGGVWQNYGGASPPVSLAAITLRNGGIVQDAEFKNNNNTGVALVGETARSGAMTLSRCWLHNNGRYGATGTIQFLGEDCNDPVVEFCRIDNNNTRQLPIGGDAGGTKFVHSINGIYRYNWVFGNYGSGLWWDGYNTGNVIENNVCEDNRNWGFFLELSYGNNKIRHNAALNNGLGDGAPYSIFEEVNILVSCSDGTLGQGGGNEIHNNLVDGAAHGIYLIDHSGHPLPTTGANVHDNDITLRSSGQCGAGDPHSELSIYTVGANNHFENNRYHVASYVNQPKWDWGTAGEPPTANTWSQWQAVGHDSPGGIVTTI